VKVAEARAKFKMLLLFNFEVAFDNFHCADEPRTTSIATLNF